MAGIYIHIPYCQKACHYCDFHFSTNLDSKSEMVDCIVAELLLQQNYLTDDPINSIYVGGGTPSLLSPKELASLLETIYKNYEVDNETEVTLEANPENITKESLKAFLSAGVNRLSLGIQSFHEPYLKYLNRVHSSPEAFRSIERIVNSEFKNFSIDLIFGIRENDLAIWIEDLETALKFKPNHISVYNLTIESKTVFGRWLDKGKIQMVSDEHSAKQFEYAHYLLNLKNYEHYEISNYCRDGHYSRHNTSYWKNAKYLGVGPGAHSYDQMNRQFNVKNNSKYIKAIRSSEVPFHMEHLSRENMINEYILTGLRTIWGCDLKVLKSSLDFDLVRMNTEIIDKLHANKLIEINEDKLLLTFKGQLIADSISSELMIETS